MKSHFELSPAEYERRRQGHLHRRRTALVATEVARVSAGDLVVELGCGPGDILASVAAASPDVRFLGLDVNDEMIEYADATHASSNVGFALHDVAVAALDEQARVVFAIDVLHHVHALDRFVAGVARTLAADGTWLVIEPNSLNPYVWLHQERMRRAGLDEDHFRRAPFERALVESGLRVADRRTAFVVPGFVRTVPDVVRRLEHVLERVPVLGGSVVYRVSTA
jgi:trans-aconitate methyltransferase